MTDFFYKAIFFDLGETLVTSNRNWIEGAPQTLQRLKATGVELGIISNTGNLTRAELLQTRLPPDFRFDLFNPDLVVLSSEVGIEKPSPDIFRLALSGTGNLINNKPCLFCTENLFDTLAAQQVGFHAARILPLLPGSSSTEISGFEQTLVNLAVELGIGGGVT